MGDEKSFPAPNLDKVIDLSKDVDRLFGGSSSSSSSSAPSFSLSSSSVSGSSSSSSMRDDDFSSLDASSSSSSSSSLVASDPASFLSNQTNDVRIVFSCKKTIVASSSDISDSFAINDSFVQPDEVDDIDVNTILEKEIKERKEAKDGAPSLRLMRIVKSGGVTYYFFQGEVKDYEIMNDYLNIYTNGIVPSEPTKCAPSASLQDVLGIDYDLLAPFLRKHAPKVKDLLYLVDFASGYSLTRLEEVLLAIIARYISRAVETAMVAGSLDPEATAFPDDLLLNASLYEKRRKDLFSS